MNGIIILEGPDACGKTTLAAAINKEVGGTVFHMTYMEDHLLENYFLAMIESAIAISKTHVVVIDRFWLSEEIYASCKRQGTSFHTLWRWVDAYLMAQGTLNVMCMPEDWTWCRDRHKANIESEMFEDITDIYDAYDLFWNGSPHLEKMGYHGMIGISGGAKEHDNWMLYQPDITTAEAQVHRCLVKLKYLQLGRLNASFKTDNLCGSVKPKIIFVCEQPNNPRQKNIPFYRNKGSAKHFDDALTTLLVSNADILVTNIYNLNGTINEPGINLANSLDVPVIALGSKARDMVAWSYTMNHPQWFNRFHRNDGLMLVNLTEVLLDVGYLPEPDPATVLDGSSTKRLH